MWINSIKQLHIFYGRVNTRKLHCRNCGSPSVREVSIYQTRNCTTRRVFLRHSFDWISHNSIYSNLGIEQAMCQPWSLTAILHIPIKQLSPRLRNNILIRDTVIAWTDLRKKIATITISRDMLLYAKILTFHKETRITHLRIGTKRGWHFFFLLNIFIDYQTRYINVALHPQVSE